MMDRDTAALGQLTRHVERLDGRIHVLEALSRPQARSSLNETFTTPLSVACVLWLERAESQTHLAKLVSAAIGRTVHQVTVYRELRRLREAAVLGRTASRNYYIEPAWKDFGLERHLRTRAATLGVKVEPKRRTSRRSSQRKR